MSPSSARPAETLVMGAAILHEGRVLAARRTRPADAAGRWELPGGKAEPGEDADTAVVREVREELGCDIAVVGRLDGAQPVRPGVVLRVAVATLVHGEPVPHEHDAVRWLRADQLHSVDWLAPDLPFLGELRTRLEGVASTVVRAVFHERDDAELVAGRLRRDGFEATVARERFAGEDDDEDHAWAVLSDAPAVVVEVLAEQRDGWVDVEAGRPVAPASQPLDLPRSPRRVKGHFDDRARHGEP